MWFDRVTAGLRRMYRGSAEAGEATQPPPPPSALEQALLAEHAALYPDRRPVRGWIGAHRWAVAGVSLGLATVVACQVPVDYERAFGASLGCELSRETWSEVQLEELAQELAVDLGADKLAIRAADEGGERRSFRVDLWGAEDLDDEAVLGALQVHAPMIPAGACSQTPLAGTVHGTLGGRLGYNFLDLDLDRKDAEEARREILEALTREGLEGSAEVEINDDGDGKREVKIRIEAYHPGSEAAHKHGPAAP